MCHYVCICLNYTEKYFKVDDNKDVIKKVDVLQETMRYGKVREYLQDCHDKRTDGDSRQGIDNPGNTRWSSRNGQINMQLSLRSDLAAACIDERISNYIKQEVKDIILDSNYWIDLKEMQADVTIFQVAIKTLQGMFIYSLQ